MKRLFTIFLLLVCLPLRFVQLSAEAIGSTRIPDVAPMEGPAMDLTDIKNIPDLYFECQIAQIASSSTVPMFYNPLVREYIEIYLLGRIKQVPELSLFSFQYFPLFEAQLKDSGLPTELKYIPVIESGLNPHALSPSGAKGLWQFMAETGRSFGLVINETFDERSDPEKSTQAACEYLKHLYGIFGDWQLSLIAYHAGPSTIKKAIAKAGGKTALEDIYAFLPVPTQRYLPAYIAVIYVLNNYKNHI